MQRRNVIIASLITISIILIVVAAFAPVVVAPIPYQVSPLTLLSPITDITLTPMSQLPIIMQAHDPLTVTPTQRPTLPAPTDTPTPTSTPTLRPTLP